MNYLPHELIEHIAQYLSTKNILRLLMTCSTWYTIPIVMPGQMQGQYVLSHSKQRLFMNIKTFHLCDYAFKHVTRLNLCFFNNGFAFLPYSLKTLRVKCFDCTHDIVWPITLKKLFIYNCLNIHYQTEWPIYLKHLHVRHFHKHMRLWKWPAFLKTLVLCDYNETLTSPWPKLLISMRLTSFNQPLVYAWPKHLKNLDMLSFNQPLIAWPKSLENLNMFSFNQSLIAWPTSLIYLALYTFDGVLTHVWPDTLQYIYLQSFNQIIFPDWPRDLKVLILPSLWSELESSKHEKEYIESTLNMHEFFNT